MRAGNVVLLTIDSDLARIAARRLMDAFPGLDIIVERCVSRPVILRRRIRRLGIVKVAGQVAFMGLAAVLQRRSRRRIADILRTERLEAAWPEGRPVLHVPSVNSPACLAHLRQLAPKVVLVVGTRIIDRSVLTALPCPFINYHAGITPKYRGIHGGYWARHEDDIANFGVTVHLVDPGIDTGAVLYQARLAPTAQYNYATFPYLQMAAALPLLEQAARDAIAGELKSTQVSLPSRLWSHPTLWGYLRAGLTRRVW